MIILKATYGDRDITEIIKSRVNNGKLVIRSNNDICGESQTRGSKNIGYRMARK